MQIYHIFPNITPIIGFICNKYYDLSNYNFCHHRLRARIQFESERSEWDVRVRVRGQCESENLEWEREIGVKAIMRLKFIFGLIYQL